MAMLLPIDEGVREWSLHCSSVDQILELMALPVNVGTTAVASISTRADVSTRRTTCTSAMQG